MARKSQHESESDTHRDGRPLGGQELPDEVQDRPEQNAGYDRAVRGDARIDPADVDLIARDERVELDQDLQAADTAERPTSDVDERAAQDAASEVRRRERQR